MSIAVVLPPLGESIVEGTIAQWLVKEGDRVARDQPLVEVTTDKIDVEIPSPATGVVRRILASAGEVVPIGAELARIDSKTHANHKVSASPNSKAEAASPPRADSAGAEQRPTTRRATPVARRVAEAFDVDPASASASGPGGLITKRDVMREVERRGARPQAPPSTAGGAVEIPVAEAEQPPKAPGFANY